MGKAGKPQNKIRRLIRKPSFETGSGSVYSE
jgi:hypothetical protein